MNDNSISLPQATPGRIYYITHIPKEDNRNISYRGFGILPGNEIKLLFKSPAGNPSAYEIMGCVIALRDEDALEISVAPATYQ